MSLTISNLSSIPDVALVKNPLFFQVNTDALYSTVGSEAANTFTFTANPTNTENFDVTLDNLELTFNLEFKTSPDDSGFQLPIGTHTSSSYINSLVTALQSNYYINKYFIVSNGGTSKVDFTAREKGTSFNVSFASSVSHTESATAGVDPVQRENFSIGCNVYFTNAGDPSFILELNAAVDDDGDCEVDIAPYLLPLLLTPDFPSFYQSTISILTGNKQTYLVEFFESYGDPLVSYQLSSVTNKSFIRGGISLNDSEDYPDIINDFLSQGKWMSMLPTTRYVTTDQHIFSNWYNYSDVDQFSLLVEVFYSDDTSQQISKFLYEDIDLEEIACIPLGFEQLALDTIDPEKTPIKYTCQLVKAAALTEVAETLTFYIEENHFNEQFFLYEGSLGTMETFRSTGAKEFKMKVSKEEFRKALPAAYTSLTRQRKTANHELEEPVKVSSGPMEFETLLAFREMLISEHVYLIKDGKYIAIEIDAETFDLYQDDNGAHVVEFTYQKSLISKQPDLIANA